MDADRETGQSVEQRWFIGAHADVGGGYPSRDLSDITLNWMQAKAKAIGLELDPTEEPAISGKNWQGAVTDSYHAFLNGAYALAHDPFYRPIDLAAGNQTMDIEVQNRARRDPTYRPQNPGFPVPPAPQAEV